MATKPEWLNELTDPREVSLIHEGAVTPGELHSKLRVLHSTWEDTDGNSSRLIGQGARSEGVPARKLARERSR